MRYYAVEKDLKCGYYAVERDLKCGYYLVVDWVGGKKKRVRRKLFILFFK
tara:strand:- start:271 stop:420 length:150 start_codon:yes stop_codon:yes gene_type:complete